MSNYAIIGESEFGGIAQLGERLTGSQKVRSSILLVSTKEHPHYHYDSEDVLFDVEARKVELPIE